MTSSLAIPSSHDELYYARGDVPLTRPLMQGDVFKDVAIPGIDDHRELAMVMMHPCSMRTGPTLRKRLTVVRVDRQPTLSLAQWPDTHYDYMPLPDLKGEGIDTSPFASCFRDIGSVATTDLGLKKRIAILSTRGLLYLQQRYIHSQTRVVVDLETLLAQMEPVFDEIELQEDWADAALGANEKSDEEIVASIQLAEREFQKFLSDSDDDLREGLKNQFRRTEIRRAVRKEIDKRYPDN